RDISATSQELFPDEGRATIGSLNFTAVDLEGAITEEIRAQLNEVDSRGINRREVRVFTGDTDNFTDGSWRQVETFVIDGSVDRDGPLYRFRCATRNREQRTTIFARRKTRLAATLTEDANEVEVISTDGFELVPHTASFSDAPNETVGYIRIRKTGEIIRYTGKEEGKFTGCTRGAFRTLPQAVEVTGADQDRWPEVEEVIYLEMPGPELAYALMTGVIRSS